MDNIYNRISSTLATSFIIFFPSYLLLLRHTWRTAVRGHLFVYLAYFNHKHCLCVCVCVRVEDCWSDTGKYQKKLNIFPVDTHTQSVMHSTRHNIVSPHSLCSRWSNLSSMLCLPDLVSQSQLVQPSVHVTPVPPPSAHLLLQGGLTLTDEPPPLPSTSKK